MDSSKETCGPFTSAYIKDCVILMKGKNHKTYPCEKCASVQEVLTQHSWRVVVIQKYSHELLSGKMIKLK